MKTKKTKPKTISVRHRCASCIEVRRCRTYTAADGRKFFFCATCHETPALVARVVHPNSDVTAHDILMAMARMTNRVLDELAEVRKMVRKLPQKTNVKHLPGFLGGA